MLSAEQLQTRAQSIRLLVLDVDGVLTDGKLYFGNAGEELKAFNILDGHGLKMLQKSGVHVGIITGRESQLVARRAENLGIDLIIQGREDKFTALQEMLAGLNQNQEISLDQIAFMGDDYPDLTVMTRVGLALTPANGHPEVVARAHWQSGYRGGEGAVREACDMLMKAQGSFDNALAPYIQG